MLDARVPKCLRHRLIKDAGTSGYRFVSVARLDFPQVGTFTRAYRALYDDRRTSNTVRIFLDLVSIAHGRTEILLSASGPFAGAGGALDAEQRLARRLVARV